MQRRLIVMRHAKSSWKKPGMVDHQRPLNQRGRSDAPRMAQYLVANGWLPEVILSSDAERTQQTCVLMRSILNEPTVHFLSTLYLAGMPELADVLRLQHPRIESVLALGHNPGWENAVHWLTGQHVVFKTASLACLQTTARTWDDAISRPSQWELLDLAHPKECDG